MATSQLPGTPGSPSPKHGPGLLAFRLSSASPKSQALKFPRILLNPDPGSGGGGGTGRTGRTEIAVIKAVHDNLTELPR